jgi:hypothetical protein
MALGGGCDDSSPSADKGWESCDPATSHDVFILAETKSHHFVVVFVVGQGGDGCSDLDLFYGPKTELRQEEITECIEGGSYTTTFDLDGSLAVLYFELAGDEGGGETAANAYFEHKGQRETATILNSQTYDMSGFAYSCQ